MSLKELVEISNFYGFNPNFVLAGGGNTSFKTEDFLYIKGSGTSLADIKEDGFVKMNRRRLGAMWEKSYPEDVDAREAAVLEDLMDAREKGEENKRPSVETSLHDLFPQRYVVHTHPALINGVTCSKEGKRIISQLFKDKALWVDSVMPGYVLASTVRQRLLEYRKQHLTDPEIVFLQNHGIFIAADTTEDIKRITDDVVKRLENLLQRKPDFSVVPFNKERAVSLAPAIRMLLKDGSDSSIVTFRMNRDIAHLVESQESFVPVSSAYTPDHIVYCRHEPLFVPHLDDINKQYQVLEKKIKEYREKNGFLPKIIAVEKLGIFAHGESKKAADIAADVFLDAVKISVYAESFGGHQFMSPSLIELINTWEVEAYRKRISLAGGSKARVQEKIVIITGSAQGFGKGIAEELAKEGANVVIADLNGEQAQKNADELCKVHGRGKALPIKVDVTDEESVQAMIQETVLHYGGLDVFVNNAGILKAGGLDEMDLKSFEWITKVNYTAYYICTKYASIPMKIQHRFDDAYYMDIIQINSKSGLEGSNKNFAYAGGKFGGIGLTQSFALELVPYNIKVNSICPGNYFEGPLWSNPENGLFVQYLKAGKVPGARTVEDVKRYYESKVPMGRGCRVIDVVRALLYCIEQQYETGQAIPVTGGQVMLR